LKGWRVVLTLFFKFDNEIQIRTQCCLQLLALSASSSRRTKFARDSLSEAFSKEVRRGSLFPYLTNAKKPS
ncbi:TPA: hypothetical protein I7693_21030, partial [Vibrio vulnificus]|nr:hypothetical protein [Vibrio vulnificus]